MAKYLLEARYTVEGIRGVVSGGGSARRAAVEAAVAGLGGKVECFYFSFGKSDAVVIVDLPDNTAAAAMALAVGASGGASLHTVVLLTPEELDAASGTTVGYRPPGA